MPADQAIDRYPEHQRRSNVIGAANLVSAATSATRAMPAPRTPSIVATGRLPSLSIAERSTGSRGSLALLRWSLVIVFLWFGGMKFTGYEASGIAPFIEHSPILSWLNVLLGVQGASDVIGILELSTAAALIAGAFHPLASALGAAMSCATYLFTLTFLLSTPGVAEPTAGGFPAISAPVGQFLLKDLVLLAASLCLLTASVRQLPAHQQVGNTDVAERGAW